MALKGDGSGVGEMHTVITWLRRGKMEGIGEEERQQFDIVRRTLAVLNSISELHLPMTSPSSVEPCFTRPAMAL
jgi:hypothetical protein